MKSTFIRLGLLGLLALMISVMAGCGGSGKDGAAGPAGSSAGGYAVPVGDNSVSPTAASIAAWKALAPQVTVTGVSIASPPVVSFTVKDAAGNAIVGLGNKSKSSSAVVAGLTNMYFTLAKLVPVAGGPSKWVTYLVTKPVATGTSKAVVNGGVSWLGTYPTSDKEGSLVDNGDGSYQYTFYRDPKQAETIRLGLTDSTELPIHYSQKADLGDVSFNGSLTHRLGIVIGGSAPGTGSNTPNGVTAIPGVNMENVANVVYDFRPDGGAISDTREIVKIDSCADCHKGKVLAHGSRKDPRFCVTCHTDQIIYSFNAGEAPGGLVLTGTDRPHTAIVGGRAVGTFNNLIHKMHMGKELVKTGYYFNADDAGRFNNVKFPQDQRNCTKCHDGSASAVNKTANGDNWKSVPSRLACGACHDGIDFDTGLGVRLADKAYDESRFDALGAAKAVMPVGTTQSGHGTPSLGGAQANDSLCSNCHTAADIPVYHVPVTPPDQNNALLSGGTNSNTNAASIASNTSNLPAGAIKVTYDIKTVSRNASMQPVMVFRMLQDGVAVPFQTYSAGVTTEIWNNFMGAPSVYFVFAVPQDGIAKPADFNASASAYLRDLWNGNGSKGTLLPDPANPGYYIATLTTVVIPDNAVMLTGGLGYTYSVKTTLPLTQINLPAYPVATATGTGLTAGMPNKTGGLIVIAPDAQKVGSTGAGAGGTTGAYSGRRAIVEDARCNKCHRELGVFTAESFHGGQRNDGTTCAWCHNPNRTSSGWAADSTNFIHGIHAGFGTTGVSSGGKNKRTVKFTWHAASIADGFWDIGYPGVLKNCESCHLPGTYDFSASASAGALPNRLFRTTATGIFNGTAGVVTKSYSGNTCVAGITAQTAEGAFALYPDVIKDNGVTPSYSLGFSFNAGTTSSKLCNPDTGAVITLAAGGTYPADGATLVDSPISTVCFACHDTALAKTHMESNGGAIYKTRTSQTVGGVLVNNEQCMLCHGSGKVADIKAMHEK